MEDYQEACSWPRGGTGPIRKVTFPITITDAALDAGHDVVIRGGLISIIAVIRAFPSVVALRKLSRGSPVRVRLEVGRLEGIASLASKG